MTFSPPQNKRFYLFGFPISRSKAPALQNIWFQSWPAPPNTYELWETPQITTEILDVLKSDECGGAAVTMPLKAAIMPFLDEISVEGQVTSACNTIVKVPLSADAVGSPNYKLVGTNTDILGVRNALLMALFSQYSSAGLSSPFSTTEFPSSFSAVLVGGGATTRSAVYALFTMGLRTFYIFNRDADEVRNLIRDIKDKEVMQEVNFVCLTEVADVKKFLHGEAAERLIMGVGAIPSAPPSSPAERTVYDIAEAVFSLPFTSSSANNGGDVSSQDTFLPIPKKRLFLDMCYTPSPVTPLLNLANSLGWHTVEGTNALIEQGKAQQRIWFSGSIDISQSGGNLPLDQPIEHCI